MNNMAKKLTKAKQQSFDTWFNRWVENTQLEPRLMKAARQGYASVIVYDRSGDMDAYQRRRFQDDRFLERLRALLPDLHVEVRQYQTKNILGLPVSVYQVVVSWEAAK